MFDPNLVLSEEFFAFSAKINEINEDKKAKKASFKALYDKFTSEIKELDSRAKLLTDEYNAWEKSQHGKAAE